MNTHPLRESTLFTGALNKTVVYSNQTTVKPTNNSVHSSRKCMTFFQEQAGFDIYKSLLRQRQMFRYKGIPKCTGTGLATLDMIFRGKECG